MSDNDADKPARRSMTFGPWATALDLRGGLGLSTFWQRRMAMLATVNKSSGRVSRVLRIVLAAAAIAVLAVPAVYLSRADGADAEEPKTEFLPVPADSEKRILAALDEPTTIEFTEAPLQTVVDYLQSKHQIQIQLDSRGLEDVGIGSDTPVTRHVKDVKLKNALELLLRDLDLTYLIQNEVLLITTKDKAEGPERMITRTYPVGDLVREDYDGMVDTITRTVRPSTWDEVGGPGVVFPVSTAKSLVITQSREVHDEVLELLRALRAAKKAN
jgi:hypothetical protein